MAVRIKAYAKINLTLEIVGQKDGYHMLDSLVSSVDLFDYIVLKKRKGALSSITMHGQGSESIPPEQNNALKAAELFSKRFNVDGAHITVHKNIPIGAGLGGSSADVAGVLNGMAKLYKIDDKAAIEKLADELGSDTRYMLEGGFARMQGRGNQVKKLPISTKLYFLLLTPKSSVSSGACYKEYDANPTPKTVENATDALIACLKENRVNDMGRYLTNHLYLPATRLNKDVENAMQTALSFSPIGALMTGSGSGVLALFEYKELCEWAKSRVKGKFRADVIKTIVPSEKKVWKNPFVLSKEEMENANE